jgi:primosomal protein N' (replication factor Y)
MILRIAIPSPLRRLFDYLPPAGETSRLQPGQRLVVPFGRSRSIGILVEITDHSDVPTERLKPALELLDKEPLLSPPMLSLLEWVSSYYHHPPGDVYHAALPISLRKGKSAALCNRYQWRLTAEGKQTAPETLARAPRQVQLLKLLADSPDGLGSDQLNQLSRGWTTPMQRLREKALVEKIERPCLPTVAADQARALPPLNSDQSKALQAITAAAGRFQPFLLDGVTGSGKTEVYLNATERVVAGGAQVLILVPEIGLTPQLVGRFRRRFSVPVAVHHSGLSEGERLCAWTAARSGAAPVVIGTRSAVFTPLRHPGLIIIDEEHDASFKQQEGFRYSARDLAVRRAQLHNIPVILGSATPSLESLANARAGRYQRLLLPERAGSASHPTIRILDVRNQSMREGLSTAMLGAITTHLANGGQVLLFLNRRGYAPTLLCHGCGWVCHCPRCDAHMTLYAGDRRLRCHHCGHEKPLPRQCPECGSEELCPVGQGTQRIEEALQEHFPDHKPLRIDRDTTRRKGAMETIVNEIRSGTHRILIGTQMLAKGHHFPDVTLVGILDADQGLFSTDFRASERMAQLILQVAGRAGRADKPGEVLIQTHVPDHPLLQLLVEQDYGHFAEAALEERRQALLPPYSHLALLRAEAVDPDAPVLFLEAARQQAEQSGTAGVMLFGPVPAPMERRAGRTRAQLLLQAGKRSALHQLLNDWAPLLESLKEGRKVRWSLDVDPIEMY